MSEELKGQVEQVNEKVDVFISNVFFTLQNLTAAVNSISEVLIESGMITEAKLVEKIKKNFEMIQNESMKIAKEITEELDEFEDGGEDVQEI